MCNERSVINRLNLIIYIYIGGGGTIVDMLLYICERSRLIIQSRINDRILSAIEILLYFVFMDNCPGYKYFRVYLQKSTQECIRNITGRRVKKAAKISGINRYEILKHDNYGY